MYFLRQSLIILVIFPILGQEITWAQNFKKNIILAESYAQKRKYFLPQNQFTTFNQSASKISNSFHSLTSNLWLKGSSLLVIGCTYLSYKKNDPSLLIECFQGIAVRYLFHMITNITHEAGHAFTAKALFNSPINIHINKRASDKTESDPWIDFSNFKLHSLQPTGSYAVIQGRKPGFKDFLVNIAGPFAGIASTVVLFKYISFLDNSIKRVLGTEQLLLQLSNLAPLKSDLDGAKALKSLKFIFNKK